MTATSEAIGLAETVASVMFPGAGTVLSLLTAAAAVEPMIETAIPTITAIFRGEPVTSVQQLALWQTIVALEDRAAEKAATVLAQS